MKNLSHILLLTALAASPVLAGSHVVRFADGRTLEVESLVQQDDMTVLGLGGGASMAVPNDRIEGYEAITARPAVPASQARAPHTTAVAAAMPAAHRSPARRPAANNGGDRWRNAAGQYADIVASAAMKHDLDPALLTAVAHVESRFNPQAVSAKGAQGILQLMPQTAKRFGVKDSFDATQNVEAGARYLSWLLQRYDGRTDLALAGYNAGEQAVDRYKGIPPFPETRTYVTRVLRQIDQLGSSTR